jgi:hypothetical protein
MRSLQICVRKDRECLVADAVRFEPVSDRSLQTGKFTGKSGKSGFLGDISGRVSPQNQSLAAKFPTWLNRELVGSEQGIVC